LDNAHGDVAKKKALNKHSGLLVWWVKRHKSRSPAAIATTWSCLRRSISRMSAIGT